MKQVSPVWAKVIVPAMKRQGIEKQKNLAEWSGLSERTIRRIKYGTASNVTVGTLGKLASALSINVTELMLFFQGGRE